MNIIINQQYHCMEINKEVFELIFPKGTFDWFEITDGRSDENNTYITLTEKDVPPIPLSSIAHNNKLPVKEFEKQYKHHLSGFHEWNQKDHAETWMIFPENMGTHLSID